MSPGGLFKNLNVAVNVFEMCGDKGTRGSILLYLVSNAFYTYLICSKVTHKEFQSPDLHIYYVSFKEVSAHLFL